MEYNLNVRQPQWKTTSMEDNINEALQEADDISLPSELVSQLCIELCPAQPQLVSCIFNISHDALGVAKKGRKKFVQ